MEAWDGVRRVRRVRNRRDMERDMEEEEEEEGGMVAKLWFVVVVMVMLEASCLAVMLSYIARG